MAGRPTKLTPETQKKIVEALTSGNHFSVACAYAGVDENTGHEWRERGEGKHTRPKTALYAGFAEAVKKALADAEARNVLLIQTAAKDGTWTAAAWWLERKYPERWGRIIQDVRHSGAVGVAAITADELAEAEKGLHDWERSASALASGGDETS